MNKTCIWHADSGDEYEIWESGCGHMFTLTQGTPHENAMFYCCHCGKPLEQSIGNDDSDNEEEY